MYFMVGPSRLGCHLSQVLHLSIALCGPLLAGLHHPSLELVRRVQARVVLRLNTRPSVRSTPALCVP